ncbi:substrate-binding periplasmic protein [Chryseosolibacter indicus]|uniref:Transporter substrate-binding domain-containing protein n=1 Tax=Chryseosolibacter indicus TaxID=2782351 RepID=A0ABS5VVK8_9BACT|nr:transporter substrate-binding domain-containing protein [Chryseosolibacter indicus]MBT1705468.1 transporter substrate-binding domain-containing protein [Chryseosolibacter indicus]
MKTITILLTFISLTVKAQHYKGDSWASVKATGSGTLSVIYYEQPGLIYKASDGKMKGVCADIVADFQKFITSKYGKQLKIEYVLGETDFPKFLRTVQNTDNLLGVTNTSITDERKKVMKFTPHYMSNQIVLLTNKNAPSIKSLKEISTTYKGYTAQVITGSTHVAYIERIKKEYYPEMKIEYNPSGDDIINNLSKNPKLLSVIDFTEYIGVIRRKIPVKKQEVDLGEAELLAFTMSKQTDWDLVWKEFLTNDYRNSVRYKEIIANNLGSSFLSLVR